MELIDYSYLYEVSDNDPTYIFNVLEIFLSSIPEGFGTLEQLVRETDEWDKIYKQAHFLKSSLGIIKISNIYDQLVEMEKEALKEKNKQEAGEPTKKQKVEDLLNDILKSFQNALPLLLEEKEKYSKLSI